jgi:hypothetical protein
LQREATLSSAKSECITILEAFGVLLPLMDLLEEAKEMGISLKIGPPVVHRKIVRTIPRSTVDLARLPKMRPRTSHINAE